MLYHLTCLHFSSYSLFVQLEGVKQLYADKFRSTVAILLLHLQQNGCANCKEFLHVYHDPRTGVLELLSPQNIVRKPCAFVGIIERKKLESMNIWSASYSMGTG
jgi:hypothetical protein